MSSKDFVDALARGSNLDAEDAFKSAIGNKVTDALETKRRIAVESGLINENEDYEDDENYSVDEDGVEWYQDEDGQWWYREPDEDDWVAAEE